MAHSMNIPSHATTGYINPVDPLLTSTNYQVIADEPGLTQYLFKNGTVEQPLKVTIRSNAVSNVGGVKVVNPAPNKGGAVQYSIKIETVGRRTTPSVADAIEDEGIAMWLTVKHNANDQWDSTDLKNVFKVLCGLLIHSDESSAGDIGSTKYVFRDLAKGITKRF